MEKKLAQTAAHVKRQYPESTVETWAEDEHRIGLQQITSLEDSKRTTILPKFPTFLLLYKSCIELLYLLNSNTFR
ncbi:hypothetical protein [Stanieria cyanosphaera]|uniref:hypothetical protein n=1 Tax=Stanieria cyanosphaera TaxID=102116 RepID=UPI00123784E1|nr:hypothetical protein [Stanieria cyanosphaera]